MLKIRLTQQGKTNQRSYRIRAIESRYKRDSKNFSADLGYWEPGKRDFKLDEETYQKLLKNGAQPTYPVSILYLFNQKKDLYKSLPSQAIREIDQLLINDLVNLPENRIKIQLPKSHFKSANLPNKDQELNNFLASDLKAKLAENNYQLIREVLPDYWGRWDESLENLFKNYHFKIKAILSNRSDQGEASLIKDEEELSLKPFNFEFSIIRKEKKEKKERKKIKVQKFYSTTKNPIKIERES